MTRPVVLIGLDGASWDVLDPLLAAGEMPTLAGLVARGASAVLRSVVPPITPAAWSSFLTGKRPGKHGIYDFRVYDPRTGADTFVSSRALREPTLWALLTAAGRRVAVVNLPMMYPPPPDAGTVVSGFDTPSLEAEFTLPRELRARILARYPDYLFVAVPPASDQNVETDAGFAAFVDQVERSCAQRTQVALDLLADGPWDAFMVHYQDTDALQHVAWRFLADPAADPRRTARLRAAYRHLDDRLGVLLRALPPGARVMVLSDHGFGPHTGRVFPNVLLQRWGHLRWRGRTRTRLRRSVQKRLARLGLGAAPTRPAEESWEARVRGRGFDRTLPLYWRRTRAYVAVAEIYGLLYLNQEGREPEGIVPAADVAALREELRGRFLAVRDPADGTPVFADVLRGEQVDPDDRAARRPDLILVPRPGYTLRRDLLPRVWIDHYRVPAGTHRPEGVLLAAGDGIRPGRLAGPVDLIDLAPTLLADAGVAIPEDVDGRVLTELFENPPAATYRPRVEAATPAAAGLSDVEESQVMERLRALGYLA